MNIRPNTCIIAMFQVPNRAVARRWTLDEETRLLQAYEQYGPAWAVVAQVLPGRKPAECQRHWVEHSIREERGMPVPESTAKGYSLDAFSTRQEKADRAARDHLTTAQQTEQLMRKSGFEKTHIPGQWIQVPIQPAGPSPSGRLAAEYVQQQRANGSILGRRIWPSREHIDAWTENEDMILREAFEEHGPDWQRISWAMPTKRTPEACRHRLTLRFIHLNTPPVTGSVPPK